MSNESDYSQKTLDTLLALVEAERPSGAYYHGKADLKILRALVSVLPPGAVQAMVMEGSLSDAQQVEFYRHGVMFWSEGGHRADLSIRDTPFYEGQLHDIVEFYIRRPPPLLFLIRDATLTPLHDAYAWTWTGDCLIGKLIKDSTPAPQSREADRLQRIAITREYLRMAGYAIPIDEFDKELLAEKNKLAIPAGIPQVTLPAWRHLTAEERERRERGATLVKHRLANVEYHVERSKKWGGDKYWAALYDGNDD
jgi:hypothetical protein